MHSLLSLEDEDSEWLSDSKSFGCSFENPSTPLSYKFDAFSEISDADKLGYIHSLLNLEDEDSEWLSDSKPFGYLDKVSFMHLLNLEDDDSEWLSDAKSFGCSSENPSTPLSYKCDASSEISPFDQESYVHSLLSLEDEDSKWLSDSKSFGSSSENLSTPLSYKYDASSEISDLDKVSFMHLLNLEDEDSERLSDSTSLSIVVPPSISTSSSFSGAHYGNSELEHLLEAADMEVSMTSRLNTCPKSSAKVVPLECEDEKVTLKSGVLSNTDLLGKEYFALGQELPIETLVGLKEFDGHEGLDFEYNDVFLLDEYLQ
uniref:Uncharacterized protein n=1 Tax=Cajanus cajan TaxID=3821 RepID=A0A151SUL0_CAJCA|nr:hypothetical protein KK1_013860 [Cajanus cajan]